MVQKGLSVNGSPECEKCSRMAWGQWRRAGGTGQEAISTVLWSIHQGVTQGRGGGNEGDSWEALYDGEC